MTWSNVLHKSQDTQEWFGSLVEFLVKFENFSWPQLIFSQDNYELVIW